MSVAVPSQGPFPPSICRNGTIPHTNLLTQSTEAARHFSAVFPCIHLHVISHRVAGVEAHDGRQRERLVLGELRKHFERLIVQLFGLLTYRLVVEDLRVATIRVPTQKPLL